MKNVIIIRGEKVYYGFYANRKIFEFSFSKSNLRYHLDSKEYVIKFLHALIQERAISHQTKEDILNKVLLDITFPEILNYNDPMPTIQKVHFMVDLQMNKISNPTINMMETLPDQMPCACIFDESKYRGSLEIFPYFRFKDEGLNLIKYLNEIKKITKEDMMVMRAQIDKLSLPLNVFEPYIRKTLNPAPTP